MKKKFFCPVKAGDAFVFYVYDGLPYLESEPSITAPLGIEELRRVCALLQIKVAPGVELLDQRFSTHLEEGHDLLALHKIQVPPQDFDEARVLKVLPPDRWPDDRKQAAQVLSHITDDQRIQDIAGKTGASPEVLRTFAAISDPKNKHLFTAENARKKFSKSTKSD